MSHEYTATVSWTRNGEVFSDGRYSRGHVWRFDGGIEVAASASPSVVPLPLSRAEAVDPEDNAVGVMTKNANGKLFVSRITLDPTIAFSGDRVPTNEQLAEIHHLSHQECFIANSVLTEIVVKGIPSH